MDKAVGPIKAQAWRDVADTINPATGKKYIETRADAVTGSWDEMMKEYLIPVDWIESAETDNHAQATAVETEGIEKHLQQALPSESSVVEMKKEPLTKEEAQTALAASFLQDDHLDTIIKRLSSYCTEAKVMQPHAERNRLCEIFANDLLKFHTKTTKLLTLVSKCKANPEETNPQAIPDLIEKVDGADAEWSDNMAWAERFGLKPPTSKSKRRRSSA